MSKGFEIISEGLASCKVPIFEKVSKDMFVFYNPVMVLNRDLSTLLLKAFCELYSKDDLQIALPLAGSGIRACRLIRELPEHISLLSVNDYSKDACKLIKKNLKKNNNKKKENSKKKENKEKNKKNKDYKDYKKIKIKLSNNEANKFLLDSLGFDYIDIDPFGSPNPFLDSAIKRLSRDGLLAVTATDTSALSGTYRLARLRSIGARP